MDEVNMGARGEAFQDRMAGAVDGEFVPAAARIEGQTVVVSGNETPTPVAVRYGWANVPDGNLFNRAGLPASPFRSDVD